MNNRSSSLERAIAEVRALEEWSAKKCYRLLQEEGITRVIELYNQDAYLFSEEDFASPYKFTTRAIADVALKLIKGAALDHSDIDIILSAMNGEEQ